MDKKGLQKPSFTQFMTEKELLVDIYGLINPTIEPLRLGIDNYVYIINSENKGKTILRLGNRGIGEAVKFEVTLIKHLIGDNVLVPKHIGTNDGRDYIVLPNQTTISMFSFVKGSSLDVEVDSKPSMDTVFQASSELGKMHKSTENLTIDTRGRRTIFTEHERALIKKDTISKHLEGGLKFVEELEEYLAWAKNFHSPEGVIHNDFDPENIMFNGDKVSAIIDFDWASVGPFIKDVGQALSLWSFRHGLEKHWDDVFNEFLRGYNSTSPHKIEINSSLYKWICFGCLSDASTFFADLVRGENWPQEGEKIKRIFQCRSYQKFLYFKTLIN